MHARFGQHRRAVEKFSGGGRRHNKLLRAVSDECAVDGLGQNALGAEFVDENGGVDANHGLATSHLADLRLDLTTDSNFSASALLLSLFPQTAAASRTASAQVPCPLSASA